jgi:phosphatidylglycerol:prolipoprotein diacylglycerol transferase
VIPYVDPTRIALFGHPIPFFPLLVVLGAGAAFELALRTAPRVGIRRETVATVGVLTLVGGFVGSHLFAELVYSPERAATRPGVLFDVFGSMSSVGGMLGGGVAAFVAGRARGLSRTDALRMLDLAAFVTPVGFAFGRLACALGHDHPGSPSTHWLAVAFPDGPRFDLGLLELGVMFALAALFAVLRGALAFPGFFLGLYAAAYGTIRFALDFLRADDTRYGDWTPAQWVAVPALLLGLLLTSRALALQGNRARAG